MSHFGLSYLTLDILSGDTTYTKIALALYVYFFINDLRLPEMTLNNV